MRYRTCLSLALFLTSMASPFADPLHLESSATRTSLLELYTSEGCSSCPPADRWISQLKSDPRLWHEVVPVAFHVDYWDYIGWNDRFASPAYSARQRDYARLGHVSTVYTPGFVLAGDEWRSWFVRPVLHVDDGTVVGVLKLTLEGRAARASFEPTRSAAGNLEFHVALLGFGLQTKVEAGENGGRTLQHDFVVLAYRRVATKTQNAAYVASFELPAPKVAANHQAVALWISSADDPRPIQSLGGWLE